MKKPEFTNDINKLLSQIPAGMASLNIVKSYKMTLVVKMTGLILYQEMCHDCHVTISVWITPQICSCRVTADRILSVMAVSLRLGYQVVCMENLPLCCP